MFALAEDHPFDGDTEGERLDGEYDLKDREGGEENGENKERSEDRAFE